MHFFTVLMVCCAVLGSPGPLVINRQSGSQEKMASDFTLCGNIYTSPLRTERLRIIFFLSPRSMMAIFLPVPGIR